MHTYGFYFVQPIWLLALIVLVPIIWMGLRSLAALGRGRRIMAMVLRVLVVLLLVALLARPMLTRRSKTATVIAVVDRSLSIPPDLQKASLEYLTSAFKNKSPDELLAVIDVAEAAAISKLPSRDETIPLRNTSLTGEQTKLADGIQMAMAIAPPDAAVRILLVSEGNQTAGDLREAARIAASNGIPVDVLPLRYQYDSEVVFRRLAAPARARSNQTVSLRFVLQSTRPTSGKLLLSLNERTVDLAPGSSELAVPVDLQPGTNVKTVSIPLGSRGMHDFQAEFIPNDPNQDWVPQNNRASAMTYVAGPGHALVVDTDGVAGLSLSRALETSDINVQYMPAADFPSSLAHLMDSDAVILANTSCDHFTYQQQEVLKRYVTDLGGGLIMVGGPEAFGAGGWIGSPVAEVLPIDLDPPQKKQLPKGALVLIMHACEMPQGNFWGKRVALAALNTLSRRDLAGVLAYNWKGAGDWVHPLSPVGEKGAIKTAVTNMTMGDMPSLHAHLQDAYDALVNCDAGQKHVIVISDGDPTPPSPQLLGQCKAAGITCTGVAVFPHQQSQTASLRNMAEKTNGRFYNVGDPQRLPQIFIKEAQVVRRALIVEESFSPQITYSLSEILNGLPGQLPNLDGYVLTGPKGGLNQTVLSSEQGDPVLATCQAGLGKCVAFTSSVDSRWASNWLAWGGFSRFWEQTVRWAAKPGQSSDCEVFADVQGRQVTIDVEAVDAEGRFTSYASVDAQIISPDMKTEPLRLTQIGPGQYRGQFQAKGSGSYIVTLHSRKPGVDAETEVMHTTVTIPFAPEFRDLSDNAALLAEVSDITGGRILVSDPNQADLYNEAGLKFPETQLPLIRPLMFLWLALFLLDVAVRRVVIDFRALSRRLFAGAGGKKVERDQTLQRLQASRRQVQQKLSARKASISASRRYQADQSAEGELPVADTKPAREKPRPTEPERTPEKRVDQAADKSHIDRLLKAKRKAGGDQKDDKQI